jgi:outer membrane lipoprotein LolB
MIKILFQVFFLGLLLSGCSSQVNTSPEANYSLDTEQRNETLAQIKQWKIDGKIAFLQQKNRESANMQWQVDQEKNSQSLNMTTYLGINVLTLKQTDDHSSIEVDGEVHHSEDLDLLIWNLTGFPLPTQALHSWIKGLPYSTNDRLTLDDNNLPRTIVSDYDGLTWQVYYQAYQGVDEHMLPKKITIKQNDLTIKISINHWTL